MTLLAIDPSIRSCGWALFRFTKLSKSGTLTCNSLFPLSAKTIASGFEYYQVDVLVIEFPEYHHNLRGKVAAQRGDTLKLACLCGMLIKTIRHDELMLPRPSQWLGQVPKHITQERLAAKGYRFQTADEADAIALGLWALKQDSGSV